MHRFLAILLLALLPLQFSWAAVASYCEHESRAGAGHVGHHEHQHHADAGLDGASGAEPDGGAAKVPGADDLDCGHCHGHCSCMLTLAADIAGPPSTARPSATLDEAGGAHPSARPERPQWRCLA